VSQALAHTSFNKLKATVADKLTDAGWSPPQHGTCTICTSRGWHKGQNIMSAIGNLRHIRSWNWRGVFYKQISNAEWSLTGRGIHWRLVTLAFRRRIQILLLTYLLTYLHCIQSMARQLFDSFWLNVYVYTLCLKNSCYIYKQEHLQFDAQHTIPAPGICTFWSLLEVNQTILRPSPWTWEFQGQKSNGD